MNWMLLKNGLIMADVVVEKLVCVWNDDSLSVIINFIYY